MFDPGMSHPGLRPEPLEFPFAAAQQAIAAIRDKIEDLALFQGATVMPRARPGWDSRGGPATVSTGPSTTA